MPISSMFIYWYTRGQVIIDLVQGIISPNTLLVLIVNKPKRWARRVQILVQSSRNTQSNTMKLTLRVLHIIKHHNHDHWIYLVKIYSIVSVFFIMLWFWDSSHVYLVIEEFLQKYYHSTSRSRYMQITIHMSYFIKMLMSPLEVAK